MSEQLGNNIDEKIKADIKPLKIELKKKLLAFLKKGWEMEESEVKINAYILQLVKNNYPKIIAIVWPRLKSVYFRKVCTYLHKVHLRELRNTEKRIQETRDKCSRILFLDAVKKHVDEHREFYEKWESQD